MNSRCLQLTITGSFQQILDLLLQSDRFNNGLKASIDHFNTLTNGLKQYAGQNISFEDIANPNGTGLSMDITCMFEETQQSLQKKINEVRDQIQLRIDPSWSLRDDFKNSF